MYLQFDLICMKLSSLMCIKLTDLFYLDTRNQNRLALPPMELRDHVMSFYESEIDRS